MRDRIADVDAESKEKDSADNVESDAEKDIANDPSVVESSDDQHQLGDTVNNDTYGGEDEIGDEETRRFLVGERGKALECRNRDKETNTPDDQGRQSKELASHQNNVSNESTRYSPKAMQACRLHGIGTQQSH